MADGRATVVVVNFKEDDKAYQALTNLKELDSQGQLDLQAAAVVTRSEDGRVSVQDEVGQSGVAGTATGGIVGLLIGIIGGPLGVLIGGATGLLIGSLYDAHDEDDTESVLSDISQHVRPGHTALLAEVEEQSPEVIDTNMAQLSGDVLRRSVEDVEAEIAAAEDAQRKAKREARKQLREQRLAHQREQTHAKIAELKAKLHPHKHAAAAQAAVSPSA